MRWALCVLMLGCAVGCSSSGGDDGMRQFQSTCGDLTTCTPGATCSFSDWERDCDCGCTPHGHWQCTPFYNNYGCPSDSTYQDAGIDAPSDASTDAM